MAIKRKLKSWRDTSAFAALRATRLDKRAKTRAKRLKAHKYYKKHKLVIKRKAKVRYNKITSSEKLFNAKRAKFLKDYKPPLPPLPGRKPKSLLKSAIRKPKKAKPAIKKPKKAIKAIKAAYKSLKSAIKKPGSHAPKAAYKRSKKGPRTGIMGR